MIELILFYVVLFSVVTIFVDCLNIHRFNREIEENILWQHHYEHKITFNNGALQTYKRVSEIDTR